MDNLMIVMILFNVGFILTLFFTPRFIRKTTAKGFLVRDYYKKGIHKIPTMGGLAILLGVMASLVIAEFLVEFVKEILILYFVAINFAMFGLADDLLHVGRFWKIFIPYFLAIPIALLNLDTTLWIGFTSIELGILYSYIIAPVYVMVVANLINMHSGYNGLSCGLFSILLIFVGIKAYTVNGIDSLFYITPILGASLAFLHWNRYPARIFWGNIGSLMCGSLLGGLIILNNIEIFGVVI